MTPEELHAALREGAWVELVAAARAQRATVGLDTPRVEALLARAWVRLGQPPDAIEAAESAARQRTHAAIQLALGEAKLASGQPGTARALLMEVLEGAPEGSLLLHEATCALAMVQRAVGEAEHGYARATWALARAQDQDEDPLRVEEALVVVGHTAWASGQTAEATTAFERVLALRRAREAAPVLRAEALDGLGVCARHDSRPFDAVGHHRQALELWVAGAGEDSGPVSACLHQLAQALHRTGDFVAARNEMARALLATGATLGKDHVDTWITRFELARYEVDCGNPELGLRRMAESRAEVARRLGDTHPVVRAMDRYL